VILLPKTAEFNAAKQPDLPPQKQPISNRKSFRIETHINRLPATKAHFLLASNPPGGSTLDLGYRPGRSLTE
jgi:hypothetical protein